MTAQEVISAIRQEIERRIEISKEQGYTYAQAQLQRILDRLDSLSVDAPEVDLEEEIEKNIRNVFFDLEGIAIAGTSLYATVEDMEYIARHFYELGKQAKQDAPKGLDEAEIEKAGKDVLSQAHKHNKRFDIPQNIFDDVQLMDIFKAGVYKGVELGRKK